METFNTLYREIQAQLSKRMAKIEFGIIKNHRDALESIQSEPTIPETKKPETRDKLEPCQVSLDEDYPAPGLRLRMPPPKWWRSEPRWITSRRK